jgi:hypothetical protein
MQPWKEAMGGMPHIGSFPANHVVAAFVTRWNPVDSSARSMLTTLGSPAMSVSFTELANTS